MTEKLQNQVNGTEWSWKNLNTVFCLILFVMRFTVTLRRLTNGGIFNNMLLFKNNRLLFSLLFSEHFCGGDKALMEGDKVVMGGSLHQRKP